MRRNRTTSSAPSRARRVGLTASGIVGGAALALAAPMAASAHIHVDPGEAEAGSSSILSFSIGHGCDGSPTTAIDVTVPDDVVSVTPVAHAGWSIDTKTEAVDGVEDANGDPVSERTSHVVYTADTPLPADQLDMLEMQVAVPEDSAGDTLAFPVEQTCEKGSVSWDEADDGGDEPEHPTPSLTVVDAGSQDAGEATDDSTSAAAGDSVPSDDGGADVIARTIGILGLAVGAAGIVTAVAMRRPRTKEKK